MVKDGDLGKVNGVEMLMNPATKIDVFEVHEKTLVKDANLGKSSAIDHHETAGEKGNG